MYTEEYVINKLEKLCRDRRISRYRLAQETGLSQSTIANMMQGNTMPTISTLAITCEALGISLSQFFLEDEAFAGLTDAQKALLREWTGLSPEKKEMVLKFIQSIK